LAGCNTPSSRATRACETFIKERLRSPSTYKPAKTEFSGVAFKSGGQSVKMVTIDYDADNAYGTPIRDSQQCLFAVNETGNFVDSDLDHVAKMSAIGSADKYASCCGAGASATDAIADNVEAQVDDAVEKAFAGVKNSAGKSD
jgi:hypothetical protein